MRHAPAVTLTVLAALLLAGCSSSASESPESAHPLGDYLAQIQVGPTDEDQAETTARLEDAIASCMTEQGFEYRPSSESSTLSVSDAAAVDPESEEFARTYGYGLSTYPWGNPNEQSDPNQSYLDSLSESELAAYQQALYGDPIEVADGESPPAFDWERAGCSGRAFHDVLGDDSGFDDPEVNAVADAQAAIRAEAEKAQRVQDALPAWVDCMGSAGYDVAAKDDPLDQINSELDALWAATPGSASDVSGATPDPTELSDLQAREVAMASADWDCSEESGYRTALEEEVRAREEAYVAEHRDELDALVARYAQG